MKIFAFMISGQRKDNPVSFWKESINILISSSKFGFLQMVQCVFHLDLIVLSRFGI